jgi:hypothetical protein
MDPGFTGGIGCHDDCARGEISDMWQGDWNDDMVQSEMGTPGSVFGTAIISQAVMSASSKPKRYALAAPWNEQELRVR